MSSIPTGFFTDATPLGLLLFILLLLFYFLMTGRLRTNTAVQELREDRDTRVAEWKLIAEDFKEAHRLSESGREMQTQIAREALEASRIQEDIVHSLRIALELARKDMLK